MEKLSKCVCGNDAKLVHDGNGECYHVECSWCTNTTSILWKDSAVSEWNRINTKFKSLNYTQG